MQPVRMILFLTSLLAVQSTYAQQVESVYLKDSVTIYKGFIIEQVPSQYLKLFRMVQQDTVTIPLADIWKITRELPDKKTIDRLAKQQVYKKKIRRERREKNRAKRLLKQEEALSEAEKEVQDNSIGKRTRKRSSKSRKQVTGILRNQRGDTTFTQQEQVFEIAAVDTVTSTDKRLLKPSKQRMSYRGFNRQVYLQFFGSSLRYAINYDTRFIRGRRSGFGVRAGIGFWNISYQDTSGSNPPSVFAIPLGVNYVFGKKRGQVELGVGTTQILLTGKQRSQVKFISVNYFTGSFDAQSSIYAVGLAYRHSPMQRRGITYRLGLEVVLFTAPNRFVEYMPALCIGYKF